MMVLIILFIFGLVHRRSSAMVLQTKQSQYGNRRCHARPETEYDRVVLLPYLIKLAGLPSEF
jgi:hypothetical protein